MHLNAVFPFTVDRIGKESKIEVLGRVFSRAISNTFVLAVLPSSAATASAMEGCGAGTLGLVRQKHCGKAGVAEFIVHSKKLRSPPLRMGRHKFLNHRRDFGTPAAAIEDAVVASTICHVIALFVFTQAVRELQRRLGLAKA